MEERKQAEAAFAKEREDAKKRAVEEKKAINANRAEVLKRRQKNKAIRRESVTILELSMNENEKVASAAVKKEPRKSMFDIPVTKEKWGARKSKIWKALNPEPLGEHHFQYVMVFVWKNSHVKRNYLI